MQDYVPNPKLVSPVVSPFTGPYLRTHATPNSAAYSSRSSGEASAPVRHQSCAEPTGPSFCIGP
jgi:hypothetical protein